MLVISFYYLLWRFLATELNHDEVQIGEYKQGATYQLFCAKSYVGDKDIEDKCEDNLQVQSHSAPTRFENLYHLIYEDCWAYKRDWHEQQSEQQTSCVFDLVVVFGTFKERYHYGVKNAPKDADEDWDLCGIDRVLSAKLS